MAQDSFIYTMAPPCGEEEEQDWIRQFSLRGVRSGIRACDIFTHGQENISQVKPANQAEFLDEKYLLREQV